MTDYPRFEPVSCRPEEAHRRCHGGSLVALVFGIVDRRALQRPAGRAPRALKSEVGVLIALVLLLIGVLAGLSAAHSQKSLRSAAANVMVGGDPSPDDDAVACRRRPQSSYPYASYTP